MSTDSDEKHISLDWVKAEGKTKMLSIHGDKGKGHKVVFLLGLTEKSIPRETYINNSSEIIAESLLNVGLTRSLKYLFIGFTHSYPSRYLWRKCEEIEKYVYIGWNDNTDGIPEPYKSIIESQHSIIPNWNVEYKEDKWVSGLKTELQVKDDISKDFEQAQNIIKYAWKGNMKLHKFGKKQEIKIKLEEDHYLILGIMSEILIHRIINKENIFKLLSETTNYEYTDDERFLICMYDLQYTDLNSYFNKHELYFKKNLDVKKLVEDACKNNKKVIHKVFGTKSFKKDLKDFLSSKTNRELSTECIWNVTLLWNQLVQKIYRPSINHFIGYFNNNINILHNNIDEFIQGYCQSNSISFEGSLSIHGTSVNKEELLKLNKDNLISMSINGRYDLYDDTNNILLEIKASKVKECSHRWIIQTLMYVLLLDVYNIPVNTMKIANILEGCVWSWNIPNDLDKLETIVKDKFSKKYKFHPIETNLLVKTIEKMRELKNNESKK